MSRNTYRFMTLCNGDYAFSEYLCYNPVEFRNRPGVAGTKAAELLADEDLVTHLTDIFPDSERAVVRDLAMNDKRFRQLLLTTGDRLYNRCDEQMSTGNRGGEDQWLRIFMLDVANFAFVCCSWYPNEALRNCLYGMTCVILAAAERRPLTNPNPAHHRQAFESTVGQGSSPLAVWLLANFVRG